MNISFNSQGEFYEQVFGGELKLFVVLHVPSVKSDAMIWLNSGQNYLAGDICCQ